MVSIVIKQNFPEVQRQLDQLQADIRDQALVRALNRTVEPARPEMAREISKEFNVSITKAKDSLKINRASFRKGKLVVEASLESPSRRGRSLNLINFLKKTVTLTAAAKRRKAGEGGIYTLRNGVQRVKALELQFQIKRGGGVKTIPGAFIGNQGRTVFIRTGKDRLPIKALQTIDIAQMFNAKRINERVRKGMLDRFPGIFEENARHYTRIFNERRAAKL
jgi:hypothetical protein